MINPVAYIAPIGVTLLLGGGVGTYYYLEDDMEKMNEGREPIVKVEQILPKDMFTTYNNIKEEVKPTVFSRPKQTPPPPTTKKTPPPPPPAKVVNVEVASPLLKDTPPPPPPAKVVKREVPRLKINQMRIEASWSEDSTISYLQPLNINDDFTVVKEVDVYATTDKYEGEDEDLASGRRDLTRVITKDIRIPVILKTAVDSAIGGRVKAQVERDIYGTQAKDVLIPAGSIAMGKYEALDQVGVERLQITWTNIRTTLGENIILTNGISEDASGRSGSVSEYDSKWAERYGQAFFTSTASNLVTVGLSTLVSSNSTGDMLSSAQSDVQNIIAQTLKEQIQVKPVIKINKGSRIHISLGANIVFQKVGKKTVVAKAE